MSQFQGQATESIVRLTLSGVPVAGIAYSVPVLVVRKGGDGGLVTRTLTSPAWVELGHGLYVIKWSPADMSALGTFTYYLAGAGFDATYGTLSVDPVPISLQGAPSLCTITGNLQELGGRPNVAGTVVFRVTDSPTSVGASILAASRIVAQTDAYGNFSAALLQGATALVEIELAGIKNQITVPAVGSATLLSLLPPF